jgi:competence protein ComEA
MRTSGSISCSTKPALAGFERTQYLGENYCIAPVISSDKIPLLKIITNNKECCMRKITFPIFMLSCCMTFSAMAANDNDAVSSAVSSAVVSSTKVDINTASLSALVGLNGLAESKAQAIIDYRQSHKQFSSVDDLVKVKGIGSKMLSKLKDKNKSDLVCIVAA